MIIQTVSAAIRIAMFIPIADILHTMIICASRRTDIPAFHSEWMINRLRAGYVLVRNPVCRNVVNRISLKRSNVDCILFMTKNPEPMMKYLDEIDDMDHRYMFQVTVTPYGKDIEPGVPPKADVVDSLRVLSERIGSDNVIWRYDPVILNEKISVDYHRRKFEMLCNELEGYVDRCTFSFVDVYDKLKDVPVRSLTDEEKDTVAAMMSSIAKDHGIKLMHCCSDRDYTDLGIIPRGCIDKETMQSRGIPYEELTAPLRPGCRCIKNIDIGAYDTCMHDCIYCYANRASAASRHSHIYDKKSEMLGDSVTDGDVIAELKSRTVSRLGDF